MLTVEEKEARKQARAARKRVDALVADAEPTRDEKGKVRTGKAKGGRFATSAARLRRIALGLEAPPAKAQPETATLPRIRDVLPDLPDDAQHGLYRLARYSPGIVTELSRRRKSVIRQQLAKSSAVEAISLATPDAAHYLHRLVRGEYVDGETPAPHAVRRQAAVDLLSMAKIEQQISDDQKELTEMTPGELQAQLSQIDAEIAALRSKPQDVVSGASKHGGIPHETQDVVSAPA